MGCRLSYKARNGKRSQLFETLVDQHGVYKAKDIYVGIHTTKFRMWYGDWISESVSIRHKLDSNREPLYESITEFEDFNLKIKSVADLPRETRAIAQVKIDRLKKVFKNSGIDVQVRFDTSIKENAKVVAGTTTILINPYKMRKDTAIHEFAHIYVDLLGPTNADVIKGMKELRGSTLYHKIEKLYPELRDIPFGGEFTALDKEVLVTAIGREGANLFDKEGRSIDIKGIIKRILAQIASLLNIRQSAASKLAREMVDNKLQSKLVGDVVMYDQAQRSEEDSIINSILDSNTKEGLRLNEENLEDTFYEDRSTKYERGTEWSTGIFSKIRSSEEYAQVEVETLFSKRGVPTNKTIMYDGRDQTFDEIKESVLRGYKTAREFGTATHIYLQQVSADTVQEANELNQRFKKIISGETGGNRINAKNITWIKKNKKLIWKVAGITKSNYSDENVDPTQEDKVATEVPLSNKDLGIATTADVLVEHANGELSIVDWKAGSKLMNDSTTSRLMEYATSINPMQDTKLNRGKMEVVLRALIIKEKHSNAKFKNLRVVHINRKDIAIGYHIELSVYLEMIAKYLQENNPELYNDYENRGLFNAVEYTGPTVTPTLEPEIEDNMTVDERITFYMNKINAHLTQFPEGTEGHNSKYILDLYEKVAGIEAGTPKKSTHLRDYGDLTVGWWKRWVGNFYDVGNARIQQYGQMLFKHKDEARKRIFEDNKKHDELLKPILDSYKRNNGISSLKGVSYQQLFGFMYIHRTGDGKSGWFALTEKDAQWKNLTKEQQAYSQFFRNTLRGRYKETMSEVVQITRAGKQVTKADLMNAPRELPEDFLPRMPLSAAEVIERHGLTSKEHMEYQKTRYASRYFDADVYSRGTQAGVLPVRFLGNQEVISDENHTLSAEMMFKTFNANMIFKQELDGIASFGESLIMYFRIKNKAKESADLKNAADFLEDQIDLHIFNKSKKTQLFSNKWGLKIGSYVNKKGEKEFAYLDSDKVIRGMKHWTSAASMWVKPVAGTANHALIVMLNKKEGLKGSVAKRMGIDEDDIDYTLGDLVKAEGLILDLAKDFMLRKHKDNKLWILARKFNYLTDNYDYAVRNRDMMAPKSKWFDQSNLYIFHQIGEDHGSLMLLAAQLIRRKNQKTGKSIWESYDEKGNWIGGIRGKVQTGVDPEGNPLYEDLTELSSREMIHMKRISQRIHGSYRQDERVALELYSWGHWILQFKKYFPAILNNIFQGKYKDMSMGKYKLTGKHEGEDVYEFVERMNEGRVRVLFGMLRNLVPFMEGNAEYQWKNMDNERKQHIIEMGVTLFLLLSWTFASGFIADDDDKFWKTPIGSLVDRKFGQDMSQGYNPLDLLDNFKAQTIVLPRIYKTTFAFWQFVSDGMIGGKRLRNGRLPGETMLRKNIFPFSTFAEIDRYFGDDSGDDTWWEEWLYGGRQK